MSKCFMKTGEAERLYRCFEATLNPQALLLCDYRALISIEVHTHVLTDQFYHNRFIPRMIICKL